MAKSKRPRWRGRALVSLSLVSASLAGLAGDGLLGLCGAGPDHQHVGPTAGEEDGNERKDAEAVALASWLVSSGRGGLLLGGGCRVWSSDWS